MTDIRASICQVHRTLCIVGEAREELFPYRDYFVGLAASLATCRARRHVLTIAEHAPEGVAGKRSGRSFCDAMIIRVSNPPVRDIADPLLPVEVPR